MIHLRALPVWALCWLLATTPAAGVVILAGPCLDCEAAKGRLVPGIVLAIIFAVLARRWRAVTVAGAMAGAIVAFLIYTGAGAGGFAGLAAVFIIALATTRMAYERKRRLGTAESKQGRNAWQVLSNLAAAATLSVVSLFAYREDLLIAAAAALAEAAADTASSECGQALTSRSFLVTSLDRVPAGTDGGISAVGTMAGAIAALLVALICTWTRLIPLHSVSVAAGAAILGNFVDSLLGATLQRAGRLNNNGVNFFSTLAAAGFALLLLL
jgi:uncharacterized protein (TIGR00297 family)